MFNISLKLIYIYIYIYYYIISLIYKFKTLFPKCYLVIKVLKHIKK